jgi:hypothetical protein
MQSKKQPTKTSSVSSKKTDVQTTVQTSTPVVAVENANKIVENKLQGKVVEVKKGGAKKQTTEQVAQPVAQTAGKGKKQTKTAQAEKVAEQPVAQVAQPVVQTAGKAKKQTKTAQAEPVAQPVAQQVAQPVAQQVAQPVAQQGGKVKKTKAKVQEQAVQQVQEQEAQPDDEEEQVGGKLRYFKLFYNGQNKGRYCGKKPKQAANKAFSSIIKELNGNGQNGGANNQDINFSIKECTRSSKHKEYKYTGKREVLPEPVPVYIPHNGTVNADTIKSESSVKNIPIRQKKVETLHSGKEVTTNGGSVFLMSDNGQTFKKITYHFHNKIQKAPKVAEEVVAA